MVSNKVTKDKIDAFNVKIHKEDGSITLENLKKLNSVFKREYIKMVLE